MPRSSISSSCDMSDISYPTTFSLRAISIESAAICQRNGESAPWFPQQQQCYTSMYNATNHVVSGLLHLVALEPLERLGKVQLSERLFVDIGTTARGRWLTAAILRSCRDSRISDGGVVGEGFMDSFEWQRGAGPCEGTAKPADENSASATATKSTAKARPMDGATSFQLRDIAREEPRR